MKLKKLTQFDKRRYDDACGTALALDLVGERWALLVVRELMFGPRRFGEIRAGLPGISANVLTQRLEGLEAAAIVQRRKLPPPASVQVYELTEWGYESERPIQELGRWAARSPDHDPTLPLSAASLMLSFRTMHSHALAAGTDAHIGFGLGLETYVAHLTGDGIAVERGDPAKADATFTGAPEMVAVAVYGGAPLAALEAGGALSIEGDRVLAEHFTRMFPLPHKVGTRKKDK